MPSELWPWQVQALVKRPPMPETATIARCCGRVMDTVRLDGKIIEMAALFDKRPPKQLLTRQGSILVHWRTARTTTLLRLNEKDITYG